MESEVSISASFNSPDTPAGVDFAIVDHTADWAIRVRGSDLRQLLLSAAWGMNSLLVADLNAIPLEVERTVTAEAFDRESLLVEWLGELAYLTEMEGLVFRDFAFEMVTSEALRATVRGGRAPELHKHIKAVTYHDLEIKETEAGLEATVVFDV